MTAWIRPLEFTKGAPVFRMRRKILRQSYFLCHLSEWMTKGKMAWGNQGLFSHRTVTVLVIKGKVKIWVSNKPPHNFNLLKMKLKTAMGNSLHLFFSSTYVKHPNTLIQWQTYCFAPNSWYRQDLTTARHSWVWNDACPLGMRAELRSSKITSALAT